MVCEQKLSDLLAAVDTLATMQLQYVLFSGNSSILKTEMNIHPVR